MDSLVMKKRKLITPVVNQFKNENNALVFGPFPADGFFGTWPTTKILMLY